MIRKLVMLGAVLALLPVAACQAPPPTAVGHVAPAPASTPVSTNPPTSAPSTGTITARIDQVERVYRAARDLAAPWLWLLPPAQLAKVRAAEAAIEHALTLARTATTVAEQLRQLRVAEARLPEVGVP